MSKKHKMRVRDWAQENHTILDGGPAVANPPSHNPPSLKLRKD